MASAPTGTRVLLAVTRPAAKLKERMEGADSPLAKATSEPSASGCTAVTTRDTALASAGTPCTPATGSSR